MRWIASGITALEQHQKLADNGCRPVRCGMGDRRAGYRSPHLVLPHQLTWLQAYLLNAAFYISSRRWYDEPLSKWCSKPD